MSERPFYYEIPFNPDQDPAMLATRDQLIDQLLDPTATLPTADVYPVLGDLLFRKDLASKYPAGTLLPVEEAMRTEQDVSLYLGKDDQIIGEVILSLRPEYGQNVLYMVDSSVPTLLQGHGWGKALFMATLKSLPLGFEVTHSGLTDDGKRMWAWLADKGIAEKRSEYGEGKPGQYITRLNTLVNPESH